MKECASIRVELMFGHMYKNVLPWYNNDSVDCMNLYHFVYVFFIVLLS